MPLSLKVIVGSTRQNRFSEIPARWITEQAKKLKDIEVELLDLRDYPLPFFDEPKSPSDEPGEYPNPIARKWAEKIGAADGFIVVTPEYNHSFPAVLKNAFDYIYKEWNKKPIGFVSYGGVGGARAIEQLRLVAIELQMAPIVKDVRVPSPLKKAAKEDPKALEELNESAQKFLDQLVWWAKALKAAR